MLLACSNKNRDICNVRHKTIGRLSAGAALNFAGSSTAVPSVGSALGCWVKMGLGLVVHIPSG
jgi:hypothetical protein